MSIEIVNAEAGTPSPFLTIVPSKDTSYSFSCEQIEKLTHVTILTRSCKARVAISATHPFEFAWLLLGPSGGQQKFSLPPALGVFQPKAGSGDSRGESGKVRQDSAFQPNEVEDLRMGWGQIK